MKKLTIMTALCVLTATAALATGLSDADKKWSAAVEQMIAKGPATISTPDENRAKLAKQLADKLGRHSQVEKTDKGYKITVQGPESGKTAKK